MWMVLSQQSGLRALKKRIKRKQEEHGISHITGGDNFISLTIAQV